MGSVNAHIEGLLRSSRGAPASEIKLALTRLATEVRERLTRGSSTSRDFFSASVDAISRIKGSSNAELRMSCLCDCGYFFYTSGFAFDAIQTVRQLERLAAKSQDKVWLRRAHSLAGVVHADVGNIAEAFVRYSAAFTLAREMGDVEAEVGVLINLGVAMNYAGLYREAIPIFHKGVSIASSGIGPRLPDYRAKCLANLAQSHLYLEEFSAGFKAICAAVAEEKEPTSADAALSRAIKEFTYVQLALEIGEISLAEQHCQACRTYASWGGGNRGRVVADIATGLCEIHFGRVDRGLSLLQSVLLEGAEGASHTAALIALVKAYDQIGQPEPALRHMHELLHHIRTGREKAVLALMALPGERAIAHPDATHDLAAMELREAKLRAHVAERQILTARIEMFERLAITADLKEDASGEHGYRVGKLASLVAAELGWTGEMQRTLELAARLHDVGKIGVPDRILLTSQELQDQERDLMRAHTLIGAELLAKSSVPQLKMAEEIARFHHEWWNGDGYPMRLAGKRIPIHARITALADVFDALTHGRPFSDAWDIERALHEIGSESGRHFDPQLTELFISVVRGLMREHHDLDSFLGGAGRESAFAQARHKIKMLLAEGYERSYVGEQT